MMTTKTALASLGLLCGLSFTLAACPATLDDRCAEGACLGGGEGGTDADSGGDAPTDPCIDTPTDAKCLDEATSLFVSSATGNDHAPAAGTRAAPLKTLGAALAKIVQGDLAAIRAHDEARSNGRYPWEMTLRLENR